MKPPPGAENGSTKPVFPGGGTVLRSLGSKGTASACVVALGEAGRILGVTEMRLYDLRVTVERIEGRSVCGLEVGDFFEVTDSSRVRIPAGKHLSRRTALRTRVRACRRGRQRFEVGP